MNSLLRRPTCRLLCLLLILLGAVAAPAADLDDSRQKLKEIERRIRQTSRILEEKRSAEQSLAADLQTVENELARLNSRIAAQRKRLAELETQIADQSRQAAVAQQAIESLEGQVRSRLKALYKGGEVGLVRILFSPAPPSVLAENVNFLGRIVRRDRQLLAEYRQRLAELKASLARLSALRDERRQALQDQDANRRTARQAMDLKTQLLGKVRQDRRALADTLSELREKARALTELVKKLESEKRPEYTEKTGVFSARKGRLPWPVAGPVRIGYGTSRHPDLGTLHDSQGIEIAVEGEKPVRAVAPGRVIFANWFKGYGNLLILDHGDSYYSLYAQAARLTRQVGDVIAEGEVLAMSGLEGRSGVYFEIRHRGAPLDPTAWLAPR